MLGDVEALGLGFFADPEAAERESQREQDEQRHGHREDRAEARAGHVV